MRAIDTECKINFTGYWPYLENTGLSVLYGLVI
ncbi:unknown [[Mannheimia] succiniciproducens MBEL55E]|uniref:Uncharacterized protein n=1 Tax=Mannheimia succiniciproducens (strain KCTC 0769BP / MBEL55E) TaxID=221988 RepID=Q65QY2_MANSM|nr:unknown [[Mannheimia] succiniciproducens MBEL55E]